MRTFRLLHGHALAGLLELPDDSVDCCITSPPYYGLRDYGTAEWDGGEPACDHRVSELRRGVNLAGSRVSVRGGGKKIAEAGWILAKGECPKCGALRVDEQLGMEKTPAEYLEKMVAIFREVRRVLKPSGTLWLNMGDSYANDGKWGGETGGKQAYLGDDNRRRVGRQRRRTGLKAKDLMGMPWKLAFALQADGWYLRQDIIWEKPNPMPESVRDRFTKAHEYVFLLTKSARYYFNQDAVKEPASPDSHARYARGRSDDHKWADGGPGNQTIARSFEHMRKRPAGWNAGASSDDKVGRYPGVNPKAATQERGIKQNASFSAAVKDIVDFRNKRSVWTISTQPYSEAHFATFPEELVQAPVLAGCPGPGKRCDCEGPILTPLGTATEDPTLTTGRAGMNRERPIDQGVYITTRRQQRWWAAALKASPARPLMEQEVGDKTFAHYIRTDRAGARVVPFGFKAVWIFRGWMPEPPDLSQPCDCPEQPGGVVLDPFCGSGTVGVVALRHERQFIGLELKAEYMEMARRRITADAPLLNEEVS